jgi:hypothetical protein
MGTSPKPQPPQIPTGQALNEMRAELARLDVTQFQTQAKSLDAQLGNLTTEAVKLTDVEAGVFVAALNSLSQVAPGVTSGVLLAVEGFEDGDTLGGVQGLMDTCAALVPMIGAAVGAGIGSLGGVPQAGASVGYLVGALIGSIFAMISDILGFFAPKTESVAKQIETFLQDQQAEEVILKAQGSHYAFLVWTTTLNDYCDRITGPHFQPGVVTNLIKDLNLVEGNTMTNYWWVIGWLNNQKHYSHRQWPLILNAACNAYTILLIAVVRLQSIVSGGAMLKRYREADANGKAELKALWEVAAGKLETFRAGNRLFLEQLNALTPPAQQWGTLWRLTAALEAGALIDPNKGQTNFGGRERKLSVAVCSKDQTSPEPPYHAYLINWPGSLDHERVLSYSSNEKKVADQVIDRRNFDLRPDDVYATPGTDLSMENHACVYELYNGKEMVGKYRKENGDAIGTFFTYTVDDKHKMKLTSVRAVHAPYAHADDPANQYLKGVRYVVYAAGTPESDEASHKGTFNRILVLPNGKGHGMNGLEPFLMATPVDQAKGIAVDQDYLWVFAKNEYFCTTHASVNSKYPAVTGKYPLAAVNWVRFGYTPDPKQEIDYLYPCDDGTLVVSVGGGAQLYTTAYRPNSERVKVSPAAPLQWTRIGNYRTDGNLEKLPVFCWPQFESLKETLATLHSVFFSKS